MNRHVKSTVWQLKKQRERVILSHQPLWPLSAIVQAACSEDKTDHEGCLDVDADHRQYECHIQELSWRSVELTSTFKLIDQYKVRSDISIPKPRKSLPEAQGIQNNGRPSRPRMRCSNPLLSEAPAPLGLPIDCYSPEYLANLSPLARSALNIDPIPVLSSLPIAKSLGWSGVRWFLSQPLYVW